MRPGPPSSPLFPYTTLFRSGEIVVVQRVVRLCHVTSTSRAPARSAGAQGFGSIHHLPARMPDCHVHTGDILPRRVDRQSTRLNSSHLVISYAVFRLKKKTRD